MVAVLGISAGYHESAAALLLDGVLVCAIAEERLSRIKNDASLPRAAIRACLSRAQLAPADLDAVVFYEDPYEKLERVLVHALAAYPQALRQFPRAMAAQLGDKVWVLDALARELGVARKVVGFCGHHEAHAASAFFVSPYERAAVLTVDGVGEHTATALWHGVGDTLTPLESQPFPHSLGLLYAAITAYLGFTVNEGEYKVMGLAAYGRPGFEERFAKLVRIHDDASLELDLDYFRAHTDSELGFGPKLEVLFGPRRALGLPFRFEDGQLGAEDQRWADIAAGLQRVTERAMLGFARRLRARTGEQALCLAGGVALNAVANRALSENSGFTRVFVQPAAGDAGGALGAAIVGTLRAGGTRPRALTHAAHGVDIDSAEAAQLASALGFETTRTQDPARAAARELARGRLVGWVQGRSEWGPRALGQRSLCALPAAASTRERINRVIKQREPFRPFAPAVLRDEASAHFGPIADDLAPFMTGVTDVHMDARERLAAVTHVDGTARLQRVDDGSAPGFAELLPALRHETGSSVILNTSLNGPGEPMVTRAADAIMFFSAHPIDALFVNDLCIRRRSP